MTPIICPDCGRPVHAQAPGGLCPACLLGLTKPAPEADPGWPTPEADSAAGERGSAEVSAGRIGRYRLLEIIGEGGFGTVWMAEQTEPVRRKVALKIIKLGMDTRQVVARFEAERQALALMDHPNIARVFDGGTTEPSKFEVRSSKFEGSSKSEIRNPKSEIASGRPYFVMELVRGLPITEFCDARQLTTRERIELFIPVCQAVQHAHHKGVIHRDLKPSNILVTEQDGRAVPKIIDFGVAKAITEPLTDKTVFTRFHQFLGTPAYMSPEQAGLGGLDIDTRTDIYALGVLLYELLTGQPPLDPRQLRDANPEAVLKTIREVEPAKPSTRLSTLKREDLTTVAARRREDPQRLPRLVRGDLDWIVLKALEKDRTRRYESANGLAADLRRYLDTEPVAARPPSTLYRIQKLARRNKLLVGAAGAVAAALLVGLITTSWQMLQAGRNLAQARLNAYVREVNVAQQALAENHLARALELLNRQRPQPGEKVELRGFEWRYLWQQCQDAATKHFEDESAAAVDFSRDGRWLAYGGRKKVVIRDATSHQVVTNLATSTGSLSFSPDGLLLATAGGSHVRLWDTGTWREVLQLPGASAIALFSPDGACLVTGHTSGDRLVLWERATWTPVATCPVTPSVRNHLPNGIAFSPDAKVLVTMWVEIVAGEDEAGLRLWSVPSLEPCGRLSATNMLLACAAFSPDGNQVFTGGWDGRLAAWDLSGVEPRLVREAREHSTHITRIAVAPGGKRMATVGEDQTLSLWDPSTLRHLARLRGHTNQIYGLAISPDGRTVVTGSGMDGVTRLWRADRPDTTELLNVGSLIAGFTADSRTLVLGPRQNDARWQLAGPALRTVAVAPDPRHQEDLRNKPFDVIGEKPLGVLGRPNGAVELWDLAAGALIAGWSAETNEITVVRFSPDSRQVATASVTGNIRIWDLATKAEMAAFRPASQPARALAYSPDGRTMAAAWEQAPVVLWDLARRQESPLLDSPQGASWLEFSPDGHTLAVADMDGGVSLFDLPSGNPLAQLKGHVMGVLRAAFFPDGKTLVSGSMDGRVKLWNLATYQEILTLSVPLGGMFHSLCIAPDGRTLAVGYLASPGRHVRLFRAPSLTEIASEEKAREQPAP